MITVVAAAVSVACIHTNSHRISNRSIRITRIVWINIKIWQFHRNHSSACNKPPHSHRPINFIYTIILCHSQPPDEHGPNRRRPPQPPHPMTCNRNKFYRSTSMHGRKIRQKSIHTRGKHRMQKRVPVSCSIKIMAVAYRTSNSFRRRSVRRVRRNRVPHPCCIMHNSNSHSRHRRIIIIIATAITTTATIAYQ